MGSLVHTLANIQTNMKFLVLAACVAVSAGQLVTHPNGAVVPADEPAVAHARAAHLATHGGVYGYPYAYAGAYPYGAVVPVDEPLLLLPRPTTSPPMDSPTP